MTDAPHRLYLGTPAGGNRIHTAHAACVDAFRAHAQGLGWTTKTRRLGSMGVERSRNVMTAEMLASDATELVFLDSGIQFEPHALEAMIRSPFDVVGVAYPGKNIDWKRVGEFARAGLPDGALRWIASDTMLSITEEQRARPIRTPQGLFLECDGLGTAMLVVRRHVLEAFREHYHQRITYRTDPAFDGFAELALWWHHQRDPENDTPSGGYKGEDYAFCQLWRMMGGKCHVYADAAVAQSGETTFYAQLSRVLPRSPVVTPPPKTLWVPGDG